MRPTPASHARASTSGRIAAFVIVAAAGAALAACSGAPKDDVGTVAPTSNVTATLSSGLAATVPPPFVERGPTTPPEMGAGFVGGDNASFEGVTIVWPEGLATGASAKAEPAVTEGPEQAPPATSFRLDGYADESAAFPATLKVYKLADGGPDLTDAVAVMRRILADEPKEPKVPMPATPASRIFMAHVKYIKAGGYSGVRFVTQLAQDVQPINNASLIYAFEGLTDDGTRWIQALLPLDAHSDAVLPGPNVDDYAAFAERYDAYLVDTTKAVEALGDTDFAPGLGDLDAFVGATLLR
ncbi:MAG: hypothetical protein ABI780_12415 [Ardenticatenales bacterium]